MSACAQCGEQCAHAGKDHPFKTCGVEGCDGAHFTEDHRPAVTVVECFVCGTTQPLLVEDGSASCCRCGGKAVFDQGRWIS